MTIVKTVEVEIDEAALEKFRKTHPNKTAEAVVEELVSDSLKYHEIVIAVKVQ